ncbi:MAG: LPXTG cell wall anchor domain-containing protein [Sterolibacteriaceae bacterium]|uniref:LPXTG cell wall anchor domain-containing protein n=1 Tax=Candidatus Methylophosphatis roskildensis TaxID=2899263 RepID=A0A9D7DYP7_9PROT|nr:LPXTG cell wall anchor domain-containing protein [Candidatus Methylophosphatis roskildensis]
MKKRNRIVLLAVATVLFGASSSTALAHGGEDHGGEATHSPTVATAPRASAQTEEFELVAVLEGKELTITLDRFATNEPVADAQIEVDSGALKAVATQIAPGVYSIPGDGFAAPGKYPLAISVVAGESADLLTAMLDLAPPVTGVEHSHVTSGWGIWGAAGALLLAGGGLLAMRRRHRPRNLR